MKENLFYWGPFLDRDIGTKKAIFNSALSINKYSKSSIHQLSMQLASGMVKKK